MTDLRKKLLINGYTPLPNVGKQCFLTGWPTIVVDDAALDHWTRRHKRYPDTGMRIENGLAVFDFDVNDKEMMDALATAFETQERKLARALVRFGKGYKEAWFFRCSENFGRLHTRTWYAPGTDPDTDPVAVVEAFGGASARQFGAFGAHTRKPDGSVEISYQWAQDEEGSELSPLTVPLSTLPMLDKRVASELIDLAERTFESRGWLPVMRSQAGQDEATRVYDLTDDMLFVCNDDRTRTLAELQEASDEGIRCSASFLDGPVSRNTSRCIVGRSRGGIVTVWDAASAVTHMPANKAPIEAEQRQINTDAIAAAFKKIETVHNDRVAQKQQERENLRRYKVSTDDDYQQAAGKLLQTYAFCPTQQLAVVPLYATASTEGMTLNAFRSMMAPWIGIEIGPMGGEKKINPVDLWLSSTQRITVAGLRMRPDQPRPTFTDDGKLYINTYTPEVHTETGGEAETGIRFLEQLVPDPAERHWYTCWFAYKTRYPAIPGPAVVMVAKSHGTGRGTMGELVKAVFGARYVKTLAFDHFAGRTYQSQYTEWQADSLVVLVNESSTSDSGSSYKTKHDTYERLKELIDPRPLRRHIVVHGVTAYDAPVFTSYIIATNNPDALPIPAGDRRFFVCSNGEPREPEYWEEVNAWIANPANIAAFTAWLDAYDIGDYSPFDVPMSTDAKGAMTEMAASDLDRGFDLAIVNMGDVMVTEQVVAAMRQAAELYSFDYPDRWQQMAKRMMSGKLYRIGVPHGRNWWPSIDGKRYAGYAKTPSMATSYTKGDPEVLRRDILRNGSPAATGLPGNVLSGLFRTREEK